MPSLPDLPGKSLATETTKRARVLAVGAGIGAVGLAGEALKKVLGHRGEQRADADPIAEAPTAPPGAEEKPVPAAGSVDPVPEVDPGRPGAIPFPVDAEAAPKAADSSVDAAPRKAGPTTAKPAAPPKPKPAAPDPEKPAAIPYPADTVTAPRSGKAKAAKPRPAKAAKAKAGAKAPPAKPAKSKSATKASPSKPAKAKAAKAKADKPKPAKPKAPAGKPAKAKTAKPKAKAAKAKKAAPRPPKSEPGNISVDKEHPHRALSNPVGDPDETEYPDPFEKRTDPRDPPDPDGKPFGEEPHPQTGSESTSEPRPSQDPAVVDGGKPPKRENLDD